MPNSSENIEMASKSVKHWNGK